MAALLLLIAVVVSSAEALKMIGGVTDHTPKLSSGLQRSTPLKALSLLGISGGVLLSSRIARATEPVNVIVNEPSVIAIAKAVTEEESIVNSLISGASTRVAKELVLHPIDTVRARLQRAPGIDGVAASQEGLFDNLYDGLLPALVGGVPAGALFFGVKDFSKKRLRKMGMGKQESTIISVMLTNIPYWVVRTPSEVLKTRRQIGYDNSSSVTEMMAKMVEEEGGILPAIKATYTSYSSNFAYALPADIVKFVACEYPYVILFLLPTSFLVKFLLFFLCDNVS
jgi:Mitochondrial carrier protein